MAASKCRWRAGLGGTGNLRAVLGLRTRRLPQECLGQGASAGRVLRHRGPRATFPWGSPLCLSTAIIMPTFSPYVKYSIMINEATPYNYPGLWRHAGLSGPPPVPQCPSVMMGTCRTCPATPRTLRAPAWSGLRNCEHLH
uniref:NADH dehydrogenase [ubiquinone] 1 alpha subcomplex subunit 3 isoform X1 n=1 Tax=Macaca mulatta TaxID=9544 RepID=UPI0010A29AD7|nr:NADH dehydrogenase [ubiquinone] 1 alpha subcomplex subunit 3 isoform X1 [Macaca mulatta]